MLNQRKVELPEGWDVIMEGFEEFLDTFSDMGKCMEEIESLNSRLKAKMAEAEQLADRLSSARGKVMICIPQA